MTTHVSLGLVVAVTLASLGCEVPELPADQATAPAATAPAEPAGPERGTAAAATADGKALPDPGDVAPVTDEGRSFDAKDPVKGRRSRSVGGYLGAVGGARFWAEHQMTLNMIKYNMNIYQSQHDGKYPPTHEAFMKDVIEFGQITLPELPDDQEYHYDPERAEEGLLVRLKQAE
ncbi:MAG: hypothetical protein KF688_00265 [Pirellulales bacterium]|nr:hypothetical protein [Pirellulales bacterium]